MRIRWAKGRMFLNLHSLTWDKVLALASPQLFSAMQDSGEDAPSDIWLSGSLSGCGRQAEQAEEAGWRTRKGLALMRLGLWTLWQR